MADSRGTIDVKSVLIYPQTVGLTFQSAPSGLQLAVGSSSSPAPFTRTVIIGSANSVSAASPQTQGGSTYQFTSWSDGGAQSHNLTAPATPTTYSATYQSTTATTTTTLFPSSVTVLAGALASGTASALASDDDVYLAVTRRPTGPGRPRGTVPSQRAADPHGLERELQGQQFAELHADGRDLAMDDQRVDATGLATVGTTEVAINNLTPTGTLTDYVSGTGSRASCASGFSAKRPPT